MSFFAMHALAAQRGDGLLPEFVELLQRQRSLGEAKFTTAAPRDRNLREIIATGTDPGPHALREGVLYAPAWSK